jgi:MscS family membrane protein
LQELRDFFDFEFFGVSIVDVTAAILVFLLFAFFRVIFSKILINIMSRFSKKTKSNLDDLFIEALYKPMELLILLIGLYFAKSFLSSPQTAEFLRIAFRTMSIVWIFYTIFVVLTPLAQVIHRFSSIFGKNLSRDVENFITKSLKIFIFALGFMALMREWGFDVSAFVASLGLGGLAFALAAKDTTANLFGSIVIFSDRPFQIGDWIMTPNVEGTVEDIGIRSTKVRAFDQSLVSVPNAVIANSAITNFSQMGKRRIKMRLGVTYQATTEKLNTLLGRLREYLAKNEEVHPDTIMIYFDEFADSSLSIFCYFFTTTTKWAEYLAAKERINIDIMKIFEEVGVEFAYPTRTIFIEK